ncbi:MAG: hypothetical protein IJV80_06720 [Clostridia bacterium]|nr:hypothetical protein [Clostridia bacterium]
MRSGFKALKEKLHSQALVKTVAWSLAAGLFAVGVLNFVLRFQYVVLAPLIYVAIGLGAAVLTAVPLFFVLYESDKRIARRLDKQHGLNESVQTMIEYANDNGEIVELQRAETEKKLSAIPAKFEFKKVWVSLTSLVVAAATFITSVLVPVPPLSSGDTPPPITDKPFALTEYHKLAVANLVEDVRSADANAQEKTEVAATLEELVVRLETVAKQKRMKELVSGAMLTIDGVADEINTCDDIFKTIAVSPVASMDLFALTVGNTDVQVLDLNLNDFLASFANEAKSLQNSATAVTEFSGAATAAITLLETVVPTTDGLMVATKELAQAVGGATAATYEDLQTALKSAALGKKSGLEIALSSQFKNRGLTDEVISRLQLIFELTAADIPDFENDWLSIGGGSGTGTDQDDENLNDGSVPDGGTQYASDDEIFDPDKGEYVPYGELIIKHQKYINDRESTLSDEVKQYFRDYFDELRQVQENE